MALALADIPIIDVDTHYNEPPDLWTSRAPARLRERVPRLVRGDEGIERWVIEEGQTLMPQPGVCVIRKDGSKVFGEQSLKHLDEMHAGATDPEVRLAFMDEHGIHAQILYPNLIGFAVTAFMRGVEDLELRTFCVQAYNDHMAEVQKRGRGRLFPQAMIPIWNMDEAVVELCRVHDELGMKGIILPSAPEVYGLQTISHPYFDPLWSAAQERRIPVNFHIGGGGANISPWDTPDPSAAFAMMSSLAISSNVRCVVNLIFSGLLDRFPRLNFVSVESGMNWIPFVLEMCEYQFDENGVKSLKLRPTEYFRRQIFASYWFEKSPRHAIESLGDENLMFETDFPHPTCLYPRIQEHIESSLGDLEPGARRRILCDNAARVYNLTLPEARRGQDSASC
jgi:predicted TIM-barrel fold metal-dependent hydrolase